MDSQNTDNKTPDSSSMNIDPDRNDQENVQSQEHSDINKNANQEEGNAGNESNLSINSLVDDDKAGQDEEADEGKVSEIAFDKDEVAEDESDDGERKKKKKRGQKRSKLDKIRKKMKTENGGHEKILSDDDDAVDSDEDFKKKKKPSKKNKKSKKQVEAEASEEEVTRLLLQMDEAWRLDKESFERKQPALHKLKLLPYVDRTLRKEYMQENFLEKDGLDYIEKWLSKMPDGASPSQTIKKKLLEIIYFLPVMEDHLKTSKLGKLLYDMQKTPNEDQQLKKQLKEIITKWSMILLEMPADYSYRRDAEEERENTVQKIRLDINEDRRREEKPVNSTYKPNPGMRKSGYDFTKRPQQINIEKIQQRVSKNPLTDEFERALVDIKKKMKSGQKRG